VIEVCNMSHPKANEPWHIWTARVAHYGHCYWPFLVLLDSSLHIFPMVPMVSSSKFWCVSEVFSLSLSLSLLLLFFIVNCVNLFLELKSSRVPAKLCYFLKYFLYYVILLLFLSAKEK
jgi:hypothetical protein